ncbi:MAG: cyclic nucleotide-binding domain-containing protein, partial [Magnetococcales bacterium]|nr:cyclic nucleotide-binding domain-containing protein [Magnetococcales bacterium]
MPDFSMHFFKYSSESQSTGVRYAHGDEIFHKGDVSRDAYMVQHGYVELIYQNSSGVRQVQTLKKGEVFGIAGLFRSGKRIVTARAKNEAWVIKLDKKTMMENFYRDPSTALQIFDQAFQRAEHISRIVRKGVDGNKPLDGSGSDYQFVNLMLNISHYDCSQSAPGKPDTPREALKNIQTLSEKGVWKGILDPSELNILVESMKCVL